MVKNLVYNALQHKKAFILPRLHSWKQKWKSNNIHTLFQIHLLQPILPTKATRKMNRRSSLASGVFWLSAKVINSMSSKIGISG